MEDWRTLLAEYDPRSPIRWYNAPWECRHTMLCTRCGKVLLAVTEIEWDQCPDLPTSADGQELLATRQELAT